MRKQCTGTAGGEGKKKGRRKGVRGRGQEKTGYLDENEVKYTGGKTYICHPKKKKKGG